MPSAVTCSDLRMATRPASIAYRRRRSRERLLLSTYVPDRLMCVQFAYVPAEPATSQPTDQLLFCTGAQVRWREWWARRDLAACRLQLILHRSCSADSNEILALSTHARSVCATWKPSHAWSVQSYLKAQYFGPGQEYHRCSAGLMRAKHTCVHDLPIARQHTLARCLTFCPLVAWCYFVFRARATRASDWWTAVKTLASLSHRFTLYWQCTHWMHPSLSRVTMLQFRCSGACSSLMRFMKRRQHLNVVCTCPARPNSVSSLDLEVIDSRHTCMVPHVSAGFCSHA